MIGRRNLCTISGLAGRASTAVVHAVMLCSALVAVSERSSAQRPLHSITGTVFDSVGLAPLSGAVVQAVRLDSASRPTGNWWAIADVRGHFAIAGVPTGRFAFGFQHEALAGLGLESPLRILDVASDTAIDLAIPRGAAVHTQSCAMDVNQSDGLLAGYVLDAVTGAPLVGVPVDVHWIEVERAGASYRTVPHHVAAIADSSGRYKACGLPSGAIVNVSLDRKGYREVDGEIVLSAAAAMRRDFHLAKVDADQGTASMSGRVLQSDSSPVRSGRVIVPALGTDVAISDGRFSLSGLPSGTWVAEAQAIGYEPKSVLIDLVSQTTSSTTIVLGPKAQPLEAVTVLGTSPVEKRKLAEILDRKRVGFGTIFMPGDERLAKAKSMSDLARVAAGFSIMRGDTILGRIVGGFKNGLARCRPTIFVDGVRSDTVSAPMDEVLAVAMYPDLMGVPVQLRDGRTCGAILVWMKH